MSVRKLNTTPIEYVHTITGTIRYKFLIEHYYEEGIWLGLAYGAIFCNSSSASFQTLGSYPNHHRAATCRDLFIDVPWEEGEQGYSAPLDETASYTITRKYRCNKYASITSGGGSSRDEFFAAYGDDKSGAGLPPLFGEIYYMPVLDSDGKAWCDEEYSLSFAGETKTGSVRNEISTGRIVPHPVVGSELQVFSDWNLDEEILMGTIDAGWWGPGGTYSVSDSENGRDRIEVSGTTLKLYSSGGLANDYDHLPARLLLTAPGFTVNYGGTVKNWDDTDYAGPYTVRVAGYTDAESLYPLEGYGSDGDFTLSHSYEGAWAAGFWYNNDFNTVVGANDTGNIFNSTTGSYLLGTDGYEGGFRNLASLQEPDYPYSVWNTDPEVPGDHKHEEYNDSSAPLDFGHLTWQDVVEFNVPMSKKVIDIKYTDTWSKTGDVSIIGLEDGSIQVTVAQDGSTVYHDFSTDGVTLAGGRHIEVDHDTTDDLPIVMEINSNSYDLYPGDKTLIADCIDLLNPTNIESGTVDTTQTIRGTIFTGMDYNDMYIISGCIPAVPADFARLESWIGAGVAKWLGATANHNATWIEYTANSDTYIYLNAAGIYTLEVANGGTQPTTPTGEILIAKVVTDATTITEFTMMYEDSFVISGNQPQMPDNPSYPLRSNTLYGTAMWEGSPCNTNSELHTYAANKDTYVYLLSNGTYQYLDVANGGAEPTQPANSFKLAKVVTDATTIVSITKLCTYVTSYYVSGFTPGVPTLLDTYTSDGDAVIGEVLISKEDELHTYDPSSDTYVFLNATAYTYSVVVNGGTAPATPGNSIPIAKVVTNAVKITGVVDLRPMNWHDLSTPVTVPWGWGVHNPNTIKFSGLRAGKTYTFRSITLRRDSETFEVHMFRNPMVSETPSHSRAGGNGLYLVASRTWLSSIYEMEVITQTYLTRTGVILVDGIVAAEIFGVGHVSVPVMGSHTWRHYSLLPNNENFMYPTNGLVSLTVNDPTVEAPFLLQGPHKVTGTTYSLGAVAFASILSLPVGETPSANFKKYFRGEPCLRVINPRGEAIPVVIKTYLNDVYTGIHADLEIGADGILPEIPLGQSTTDWGTIVSHVSGNTYVVSGLSARDYTGYALYFTHLSADPITCRVLTILSHNRDTNTMELSGDLITPALNADLEVSVHLPYTYKLEINGNIVHTFSMCNRSLIFGTLIFVSETSFLVFSAYQEPFSDIERIVGPDVDSKPTLYQYQSDAVVSQEPLHATHLVNTAQAHVLPSGKVVVLYSATDGSGLYQHLTDDEWASKTSTTLPSPDATPPSGESWDKFNALVSTLVSHKTARDGSGNKVSGRMVSVLWYKTVGQQLGRPIIVAVGDEGDADEWAGWAPLDLEIPAQAVNLINHDNDRLQMVYFTEAGLSLANLTVGGHFVEGFGGLGTVYSLSDSVTSQHPSVAIHLNTAYVVTWESDTKKLRYRSYQMSFTGWTLLQDELFNDAIADGTAITQDLIPQKVALYVDASQRLRCFRWESDQLVGVTLHHTIPGV